MARDGDGGKPRSKPTGKKVATKDDRLQAERFIEISRQLGIYETGKNFENVFDAIIKLECL